MTRTATAETTISNKLGLHIRPSRQLAELARSYDADVTVRNGEREAAADSQLDLLMLVANKGARIELTATGPQADDALAAIVDLIESRFGESE